MPRAAYGLPGFEESSPGLVAGTDGNIEGDVPVVTIPAGTSRGEFISLEMDAVKARGMDRGMAIINEKEQRG